MSRQNTAIGPTITLAKRCQASFERKDWYRGIQYFQASAVKIVGEYPDGVAAEVRGSYGNVYAVQVSWDQARKSERLDVSCECARSEDGYFCKHIAATIQAIDAKGLAHLIPGQRALLVSFLNEDNDDDPNSARDNELASHDQLLSGLTTEQIQRLLRKFDAIAPARPKPKNKSKKAPDWRKQLDEIRRTAPKTAAGDPPRARYPESHRVIYLLDLSETARRGRGFAIAHESSNWPAGSAILASNLRTLMSAGNSTISCRRKNSPPPWTS